MALSLAQRTQLRKRAAAQASVVGPAMSMEGATAYELQLAQLLNDRLRLKSIQGTEAKIALKHTLLPAYEPYVSGVLSAGNGAQDDVLVTVMTWRIDTGDYAGALDIAAYVLPHKLKMPDAFNRTIGTVVAEEIAEAANKALRAGQPFDVDVLHRTAELTAEQDMPDQARAKLHLAIGRATLLGLTVENPGQPGQLEAGIEQLRRAITLHDNCGGKQELQAAERVLKKHAGQAS